MEKEFVRNEIVLYYGCGEDKKEIILHDFKKLDHINFNGVWYIRILCGNRYYYYETHITSISEIIIY